MKIKITDILKILFMIYLLIIPGLNIVILLLIIARRKRRKKFEASKYGEVSGNTYKDTMNDIGLYGEYRTFIKLEKLEGEHKLFTNLYIPKEDGTTAEIENKLRQYCLVDKETRLAHIQQIQSMDKKRVL